MTGIPVCAQQFDSLFVEEIQFSGNKKTKPGILQRELTVYPGRYYERSALFEALNRSKQNLMNTRLFNFVDLVTTEQGDTIHIEYQITERWYLWPSPIFEYVDPNFNTWLETKDLSRTSYGLLVTQFNFRGRNESLRLRLKFGYNNQYAISYEIPYIDKSRKLGIAFYAGYFQNYQINTGTEDNKRLFYTLPGGVVREEKSISTRLQYRKATYGRHYLLAKYNQIQVTDSVAILYPDYLSGGLTNRAFLEFGYQYTFDKRDYSVYPLKGTTYTVSLSKPDISLTAGKPTNVWQGYAQLKKYHELARKWFFAYSISGKYTAYKSLPYYFQRGLGYSDFVRGYEYYIVDAQHYAILKSNLKFRLIAPKEFRIGFIRNPKFNRLFLAGYLNLNADAGYAVDHIYGYRNPLSNTLLVGGGIGLDLISFYDVVVRCEYSLNRLGVPGFFMHFSRPI